LNVPEIAILEDNAERCAEMRRCLASVPCNIVYFADVAQMCSWLEDDRAHLALICLDNDLPIYRDEENRLIDAGSGVQVAEYLAQRNPICPVIVHSSNAPAAHTMAAVLKESGWSVSRVIPHDCHAWIADEWKKEVCACLAETLTSEAG